jgi:hypothetical protein
MRSVVLGYLREGLLVGQSGVVAPDRGDRTCCHWLSHGSTWVRGRTVPVPRAFAGLTDHAFDPIDETRVGPSCMTSRWKMVIVGRCNELSWPGGGLGQMAVGKGGGNG